METIALRDTLRRRKVYLVGRAVEDVSLREKTQMVSAYQKVVPCLSLSVMDHRRHTEGTNTSGYSSRLVQPTRMAVVPFA
jgi:hypothetical protein